MKKKVALIDIANVASELRYFPLALMLLKSLAENRLGDSYNVEVKTFFDRAPRTSADVSLASKIISYVCYASPDVIGFSCYLWNTGYILYICKAIKRLYPDVRIILGGPEISPNFIQSGIDFVVVGEGEESFVKILEYYDGKIKIKDIPNAVYLVNNQIILNPTKDTDLNCLVSPFENVQFDPSCEYYMETSRGCPYSCNYCTWKNEIRMMPESYIDMCLKKLLNEWGVRNLFITDSNFNMNHDHMNMVMGLIKKYNTHGTEIKVGVKVDLLDDETIRRFKEAGIMRIDIGVQSTDPQVLKTCNRTNNLTLIKNNLGKILSEGLIPQVHLITGLPDDNFFKSAESLKFVTSIDRILIAVNAYIVLKHSEFYGKDQNKALLEDLSSRCVGTNSQSAIEIERSLLFLKTYEKEYRVLQSHSIYDNAFRYR